MKKNSGLMVKKIDHIFSLQTNLQHLGCNLEQSVGNGVERSEIIERLVITPTPSDNPNIRITNVIGYYS